jgi:hypothetical protein
MVAGDRNDQFAAAILTFVERIKPDEPEPEHAAGPA